MRASRQAFPVALYASLLVALLCLVRPEGARTFQSWCATLQSLPLRVQGLALPSTALELDVEREAAHAEAAVRVHQLAQRRALAARRRPAGVPAGWVPNAVRVRDRRGDRAAPDVLVLDVEHDAVGRAASWVTIGDKLVGVLDRRPPPAPEDDPLGDRARVLLLHHRERARLPRRVPAYISSSASALRIVVEPAASIDRWPLRCTLPEDPYAVAKLSATDLPVHTSGLQDDPLGPLPADLRIGTLRVYGYQTDDGRVLPIGLFVEPAVPAGAIHSVVVWTRAEDPRLESGRPFTDGELIAVRSVRLPVPTASGERLFVTSLVLRDAWLRSGSALVAGERLVGVLDTAGLGYGVVAAIGQPGRSWPLVLVPDGAGAPVDVVARGRARADGHIVLDLDPPVAGFERGQAFSGPGGRDLPGGLWVGPARLRGGEQLIIETAPVDDDGALAVFRQRQADGERAR